jgi:DNA-binding transcriptional LysR family regulator
LAEHGSEAHAATLAPRTLAAVSATAPLGWLASLGLAGKLAVVANSLALLLALVGGGLALWMIHKYPFTPQRIAEVKSKLDQRRANAATPPV